MEWKRGGTWFITSDAGYNVSKAMVGDAAIYTAWSPKPEREILINTPNVDEAKSVCEEHCKAANRDVARAGGSP